MMDRRKWCSLLVAGGSALGGAVVAVPALVAALSPAWKGRRGPTWRPLGPLADFTPDKVAPATLSINRGDWARSLDEMTVYVWRRSAEDVVVYSRNCTDLSCPLTFDAGSECFFCPCHGGIFGKDGERMAGPPLRPLYRYDHRIRDDVLEIDLNSLPPIT